MPLQLTYKPAVDVQAVIIYVSLPTDQKASFPTMRTFSDTEYPESL